MGAISNDESVVEGLGRNRWLYIIRLHLYEQNVLRVNWYKKRIHSVIFSVTLGLKNKLEKEYLNQVSLS